MLRPAAVVSAQQIQPIDLSPLAHPSHWLNGFIGPDIMQQHLQSVKLFKALPQPADPPSPPPSRPMCTPMRARPSAPACTAEPSP